MSATDVHEGSRPEDRAHEKHYEIVVNGAQAVVHDKTVSYEQVVAIAFPTPANPGAMYTVTYRGTQHPKEGSLQPGGTVDVKKDGAVFNVTPTTKS